ncbi:MAG TPA: pantoate--beta-alanine ligase [Bacteroidales bacterium]|nr:pantoate--beta-alanine ligase [Bacteroidales bacterium]HPR58410.1 pantoate--beta-alanine ligase [Bacteroidales bacterium]HRW96799.1 pantoate--beta-alanine ligase [Bacteroidales bacterium]
MIIAHTIKETRDFVSEVKSAGKSVGFVPTMGALHSGHLALINRATAENDIVVVSIFVNPIQFNNKTDLETYPRPITEDIHKLEEAACDLLFNPEVDEMYPEPVFDKYDFGHLDKVMEGKFRPGHFNGVAVVVRKLFEIVTPDKAYFGQKDFQQLRIIQTMTASLNLPVEIVPCPTVREKDGLAMSSRNKLLSQAERKVAPAIYQVLNFIKENAGRIAVQELAELAVSKLNKYEHLNVEYVEIVDAETLLPVQSWSGYSSIIACAAVYNGKVRLIDNILIY